MKVRIMIADDHKMFRQALAVMLHNEPSFEIVGEAENGRDLVDLAKRTKPHVVCMDVAMPQMNGIEATQKLREIAPTIAVIGLSGLGDEYYVRAMMLAGAVSFVAKSDAAQTIVSAIWDAHCGSRKINQPGDIAWFMPTNVRP